MAEMIRPEHRGKALGSVQSAWAVGWGAAVLLSALVSLWLPPEQGWRMLFAIGVLPALLIIYVRRSIPEPDVFVKAKADRSSEQRIPFLGVFAPDVIRMTSIGALLGVGAHGGFYALNTFLPAYLLTERKLSVLGTSSYLAVIIFAFWCGCIASAYLQDRIGQRATFCYSLLPVLSPWSSICSRRSATRKCSFLAFRSDFSRPESPRAWARCSMSFIQRIVGRALAFATISGGSLRLRSHLWLAI